MAGGRIWLLIPFVFIYLSCLKRWGLSGPRNRPSLFGLASHGYTPPPLSSPAAPCSGSDLGVIVRSISITADQSGAFCPPQELLKAPYKVHTKGLRSHLRSAPTLTLADLVTQNLELVTRPLPTCAHLSAQTGRGCVSLH